MDVCHLRHAEDEVSAVVGAAAEARPGGAGPASGEGGTSQVPRHSGLRRGFVALAEPDFRVFLLGALVTSSGIWMQNLTVPFLLYQRTGRATWAGIGAFCQFMPATLAAPVGGVLADVVSPRRILAATQCTLFLVALALWAVTAADVGGVAPLLALVIVTGLANGLQTAAWQSLVARLVPSELRANAVTLNALQANAARAIGPLGAGLALATWGAEVAFLLTAAGYTVMLGALTIIRPGRRPVRRGESALRRLMAGVRYTRRETGLALAVATTALVSFVGMPVVQLAPVLGEQAFGAGPLGSASLAAGLGTGALVGTVVVSGYAADVCRSTIIAAGLVVHGLAALALAVSPTLELGVAATVVLGASFLAVTSTANATAQVLTAEAFRGRVVSLYWMAFAGGYPLGSLVQGWLADGVGVRWAIALAAVVLFGVAAVALRPGLLRAVDAHVHLDPARPSKVPVGRAVDEGTRW